MADFVVPSSCVVVAAGSLSSLSWEEEAEADLVAGRGREGVVMVVEQALYVWLPTWSCGRLASCWVYGSVAIKGELAQVIYPLVE